MSSTASIAEAFHMARRKARPLPGFPGDLPAGLPEAYAIQERSISLWPDEIAGWKVAAIHPDLRAELKSARMSGPAFSRTVIRVAPGETGEIPVISGGFIAVETEIGIVLKGDIAPRSAPWTTPELLPFISGLHLAMEIAGSPLLTINDIGPWAIVSDFGNNSGIAVGSEIKDWDRGAIDHLKTAMRINGKTIGEGRAVGANGGPLDAFLFLVNHLATRNRGLRKGDVIIAGATTGVHPIEIGQLAEAVCDGCPSLAVRITGRQQSD
jgi:2-keto-4-pentenoate hydratase